MKVGEIVELKPAQQRILDDIKQEIAIAREYKSFEEYAAAELPTVKDKEAFRRIYELKIKGCLLWASNSPLIYLQNRGIIQIIKNGYSEGVDIVKVIEGRK